MKCPKGTRKNKKTGNCEAKTEKKRCPNGSRKNKKTRKCEPRLHSLVYKTASLFDHTTKYKTASLYPIDYQATSEEFDKIERMPHPIDIFDQNVFHLEIKLLSKYYSNLELMLSSAILVDYIHNHRKLKKKDFYHLIMEFTSYKKTDFDKLLNVFDMQYLLEKWFYHFKKTNKDADKTETQIENLLLKYINNENLLWNRLYKKYVDKNWNTKYKLWFDKNTSSSS